MFDRNPIEHALAVADAKYADNVVIKAIAQKLRTAQAMAEMQSRNHSDILLGYRAGALAQEGYGLMHSVNADALSGMLKEMSALHTVGIIAETLVEALNALGEDDIIL